MTDPAKQSSMKVQDISQLAGIFVIFGFMVSLIYDWGFFHSLGVGYRDIPSSIADHFRTGLIWAPPLFGLFIFYLAWEFQIQRIEKGLTEEEIVNSSKDPDKTRRFRERPYKFLIWVCVLAVLNYILVGDVASSIPTVAFAILWLVFADWCYATPLIQLRRNEWVQFLFKYLPTAAILAYAAGYSAGTDAVFWHKSSITINAVGNETKINGTYLRGFESGLLYLSKDDKPTFIRWDSISSYTFETQYKPYKGLLCSWFNVCTKITSKNSNQNSASNKAN
jgi:hypothetical protein